jgi:hypothetical protein
MGLGKYIDDFYKEQALFIGDKGDEEMIKNPHTSE